MKNCRKCFTRLPLSEFYSHKQMKEGRLNICKGCTRERVALHRQVNAERVREYDRQRGKDPKRVKLNAMRTREFRRLYPEKSKAHNKVNNALRSGRIKKPTICSKCRNPGRQIEAHHYDYSKPLEVQWLCSICHKAVHRDIAAAKQAKTKAAGAKAA